VFGSVTIRSGIKKLPQVPLATTGGQTPLQSLLQVEIREELRRRVFA
jgi:hypothetical protein